MAVAKSMVFTKSQAESNPNNVDYGGSLQPDSSALEDTIDRMATTTDDDGSGGLCPDPRHFHSFRTLPFIMLPLYTCGGCGERLQPYVVGGVSSSHAAVRCIACGVYAHRHCAFSKDTEWKTKCASAKCIEEIVFEDADTIGEKAEDKTVEQQVMGISATTVTDEEGPESILVTESADSSMGDYIHLADKGILNSIFRSGSTKTKGYFERQNIPTINISASMDGAYTNQRNQNDVQRTKANFPFLSSASLLLSHKTEVGVKNPIPAIRQCKTWNGYVESSSPYILENSDDSTEEASSESKDDIHKVDNENTIDPSTNQTRTESENNATAPLHFASHGFRAFSQALQENIVANFDRLIPKEKLNAQVEDPVLLDNKENVHVENDDTPSEEKSQPPESEKSTDEDVEDKDDNIQARSLLETSNPKNDTSMDRKRIGLATVAGTIVGGVVGVGLAGPVGGVIGVKCGQTAGMLGLLLEGSVTASVLASGISVGMAAGQRIDENHETRVLALGEGTKQRVLLMVRPTIRAPEPIWDELYTEARKSYHGSTNGIVDMLIPNESRAAKRERYEREVDIVETGEDELAIADKVILLASRILSNKDSLPGHVYRKLVEAFRCRCRESNLQDLLLQKQNKQNIGDPSTTDFSLSKNLSFSGTIEGESENDTEEEEQEDEEWLSHMHQRRRDAHAVIKYVTTSLLLTRPGFGYSSSLTEKTATAVESLVFGEIYGLVMEEIEVEYQNKDDLLLDKIADFERHQRLGDNSIKPSDDDLCIGYKSCISEGALEALHCLPQAHSAVDKLRYCVVFLEEISEEFSKSAVKSAMSADSLLKMVCQHILLAKVMGINAQIAFLEEYARDEQLLRGREGYALVTLQASLHFLNASQDFKSDIFSPDED